MSEYQGTDLFSLGGPGSGKGSICKRILTDPDFQGVAHVSIGDFLRVEIEQKGVDGPLIEQTMKDGKLLPSSMILHYLRKAIDSAVQETGKTYILLDGFPRMVPQAKLFVEQKVRCYPVYVVPSVNALLGLIEYIGI